MRLRVVMLGLAIVLLSLGNVMLSPGDGLHDRDMSGPIRVTDKLPTGARAFSRGVDVMSPEDLRLHGPKPLAPPPAPGAGLVAFEGLSTWVDTYDTGLTPEQQVEIAAAYGVDTIFMQVSRISTDGSIHDYDRLSTVIEQAHDRNITVMVWTIPTFTDLGADVARAQAAMAFVTPRGDRPDAFGLDIEAQSVADVAERTRRLLLVSERLRWWVGPDYPLAAIVLPPLQLELNTVWWPGFPYAELAEHYDVFIPMSYSSYRGSDPVITHQWNHDNVVRTRQLAGDPELPVHLAGGIADALPAVPAFVRAGIDTGVIGAGLYDLHTTRPEAWPALGVFSRSLGAQAAD